MNASLTRRAIFAQAWPIMLGQATIPLVGLVDTAVIGRTGDTVALAGVALGATVINFFFWSFGFLRMGVTGLTAQAHGAGDHAEVAALLARGVVMGLGFGAALLALQVVLIPAAFAILAGGADIDRAARAFLAARFLSAPALLGVYAINGWLLGLGQTREALVIQIVANLANIVLDVLFVWHFHWGVRGVGLGTAAADWIAFACGLVIVSGRLGPTGRAGLRGAGLFAASAMRRLLVVNADIMIRTIALLVMFTWFANAGARLGATQLAANQVLMQFVSISAFVLDGFCFTAESRIGQAIGAGSRERFWRAIRLVGEFCLAAAAAFAIIVAFGGGSMIDALVASVDVRHAAYALVPLVALVPLIGVPAWLLDGVFIGATEGRALRNAAIASTTAYIGTDLLLRPYGATGLWLALIAGYAYRAMALGAFLPGLAARITVAKRASAA
ncbi:MATE family efflux transporter [Sphingomonas sp. NFR15]|uniref:MATE family efflux transporter n=1 Tax=Sphingomonas sp. NFR15 TaxID=1566282 RepID=UPI0008820E33|nr:MATE family efflux transporter [Sphingomonas sp. NFR15]SDA24183.1 multidrug resistance protein, MATE family [Sphingomonas sp. NFR15]